ncbi:MAG: hypothetical protein ACTS3F_11675 [Phycisphaerales bacterium]
MNLLTRNDIAAGAIVLSCCFGAAHLTLGWANDRLDHARRSEAAARSTAAMAEGDALAYARQLDQSAWLRESADRIATAATRASNEAVLYDEYTRIAASSGVKIARMGPTSAEAGSHRSTRRRGGAGTPDEGDEPDHRAPIAYFAEAEGPASGIVAFLDAIERDLGHTRIVSAKLTPVGMRTSADHDQGAALLRLSVRTLHHRFIAPELPAALRGGSIAATIEPGTLESEAMP